MKTNTITKIFLTLSFIVMTFPLFASSENGGKKMIVGALSGLVVYGGMAIYRSFKNKK